jgi:hypothetical protein
MEILDRNIYPQIYIKIVDIACECIIGILITHTFQRHLLSWG